MANKQRDPRRETRWRKILANQAVSGLSVREFCRRQKLTEASFYFWRRTIAERDGEPVYPVTARPTLPTFLPVRVSNEAPSTASISIELAGGRVLKLPESMSTERLVDLIDALEARVVR
jgi:hypothetical protein